MCQGYIALRRAAACGTERFRPRGPGLGCFPYLLTADWLTWSKQLHTAPTLLLTSVTPMSPR